MTWLSQGVSIKVCWYAGCRGLTISLFYSVSFGKYRWCYLQFGHYHFIPYTSGSARSEPGGTRWRTGEELKEKLGNGVVSQYSHATSERGLSSITQADAHTSAASSRLNWGPHRFKWTHPFRGKTKSGFCACAITFRTSHIHCYHLSIRAT